MNKVETDTEEGEGGDGFLSHLPTILWHRRWLIIVPLVICAALGIAAAILLPATYRSEARLLVESQELPAELVGTPVTNIIDQRIARIRQQITSRPDLTEIILANNLYADERGSKPLSLIINKMRDSVLIQPVNADIGPSRNGGSATVAFTLSFDYPQAAPAQAVTQEFVERLLRLDQTQMSEQAEGAVEFLQEQAKTIQDQIAAVEGQILTIKAQNGRALSGGQGGIISMGGGYDSQIASIQRENTQLQIQASRPVRDPGVADAESRLAAAKARYADTHPDVILAQQQLDQARSLAGANPQQDNRAIAAQIAANNAAINQLNAARMADMSRAAASFSAQSTAPAILEQVAQLEARADGLRNNYQRVAANLMSAQSTQRLDTEQKGEHLSIVEPPTVPDRPTSPNRPLLIAAGFVLGAGLGFVLAMGAEMLMRPIRGVGAIAGLTGATPLVVIPNMKAKNVRRRGRFSFFRKRAKVARAG